MAELVSCPGCDRTIRPNNIARHVLRHDPEHVERIRVGRNEAQRRYHQTLAGQATAKRAAASPSRQATHRRASKQWRASDQGRLERRAHAAVSRAIKSGVLVRKPCQECGRTPTHAHHHNGYAPEHVLDVVWLCELHHQIAHGREVAV